MKDLEKITLPYPSGDAKNLFIRDDKKRNYYLLTIKGENRVDLKKFRRENHTRALSFASDNDLQKILDLQPGSVTPLGLLNDDDIVVRYFIDKQLLENPGIIGVHPNENTATVWLKTQDLIRIIQSHGNDVNIVDM